MNTELKVRAQGHLRKVSFESTVKIILQE